MVTLAPERSVISYRENNSNPVEKLMFANAGTDPTSEIIRAGQEFIVGATAAARRGAAGWKYRFSTPEFAAEVTEYLWDEGFSSARCTCYDGVVQVGFMTRLPKGKALPKQSRGDENEEAASPVVQRGASSAGGSASGLMTRKKSSVTFETEDGAKAKAATTSKGDVASPSPPAAPKPGQREATPKAEEGDEDVESFARHMPLRTKQYVGQIVAGVARYTASEAKGAKFTAMITYRNVDVRRVSRVRQELEKRGLTVCIKHIEMSWDPADEVRSAKGVATIAVLRREPDTTRVTPPSLAQLEASDEAKTSADEALAEAEPDEEWEGIEPVVKPKTRDEDE